ncbi:hypothetical protein HDZ31DRAFT_28361 [Schizophyllum fasciatum]
MAENAYPSPTQSVYTEDFEDHTGISSPSFTSDISRNLNAQNSLRQTSETLQATYRRLRQVRQSLMELTASLPSHSRQLEDTMSLMDPGHEAISLVDHNDNERRPHSATASTSRSPAAATTLHELERLRPTLPPETYNRIRQFAMRYDPHASSAPGTPALRVGPLPIPSPVTGLRSPLSPRSRPSLAERRTETAFVLRRGDEDAQTTLGRRVTAREASPSPSSGDRGTLPALRILRTLSRTPDTRPSNIDGDALSPLETRSRTPAAGSELPFDDSFWPTDSFWPARGPPVSSVDSIWPGQHAEYRVAVVSNATPSARPFRRARSNDGKRKRVCKRRGKTSCRRTGNLSVGSRHSTGSATAATGGSHGYVRCSLSSAPALTWLIDSSLRR